MAKKSKIEKNKQIAELIVQYAQKRKELNAIVSDPNTTMEEKQEAQRRISKLPKNSCPIRYRNRCGVTGRPRGYIRKFRLSRITFRELALEGKLPGITKSSW